VLGGRPRRLCGLRSPLRLALAVVWCLLTSFDGWNFVAGLVIGACVVGAWSLSIGRGPYIGKGARLVRFLLSYLRMINVSNFKVAWEVLTPRFYMSPRIVRYPVAGLSDAHLVALSNAITLTPGTLVVDLSPDRRFLYVHCMYARDRDQAVSELDDLARQIDRGVFA